MLSNVCVGSLRKIVNTRKVLKHIWAHYLCKHVIEVATHLLIFKLVIHVG